MPIKPNLVSRSHVLGSYSRFPRKIIATQVNESNKIKNYKFKVHKTNLLWGCFLMRVLALVPSFYGHTGDAVNERQLLMALSKKVEKTYIVTFIGAKQVFTRRRRELREVENLPQNMTIIPIPFPQIPTLLFRAMIIVVSCIVAIIALLLNIRNKIDLIYIRDSFLSIGFLTFRSLAHKTIVKVPAIIEDEIENEGFTKYLVKKVATIADRLVLAKAKKVAVNNRLCYNELVRRRCFKHEDRPLEIPPGVDLNLVKRVRGRMKDTFQQSVTNICFLGSLIWWQGIGILIQAVSLLKNKLPNLKLKFIGDGPLRPYVEKQCNLRGISYILTGFLPHEEALNHLAHCDVMVLPRIRMSSTETNIPIKIIEAWALGVPVIATKHQVLLELGIKDRQHIIYCEPNSTSVANAILELLTNRSLKKVLKENGPKLAERFNYQRIAERIIKSMM